MYSKLPLESGSRVYLFAYPIAWLSVALGCLGFPVIINPATPVSIAIVVLDPIVSIAMDGLAENPPDEWKGRS